MFVLTLALAAPAVQGIAPGETVVESPRAKEVATETAVDRVVVTSEELQATGERSLPRMIGRATGVWIQETNLGGGSPIVNGKSGNQVLLVVDGVRLNDSTTRTGVNQMLNGIDPAAVERVEVIRGPRSVLYGSDALGGVLLVWTKRRAPLGRAPLAEEQMDFDATVDGGYQSVSDGVRGSLELSDAWERHGLIGVGSYHKWHDVESAEGDVPNTGYDGWSFFGAWEAALDPYRSLRASSIVTKDFDVPRTDRLNVGYGQSQPSNDEFDFAIQDRQRAVLAFDDRESGVLADALQVRASFRYYNEDRRIRSLGSSTRRLEHDTTNTLGLGVDFTKAFGDDHLLTYGLDVDYDDVDSGRVDQDVNTGVLTPNQGAFAPGSHYLSTGVFVQDEIQAWSAFDVTLGLRYGFFAFGFRDPNTNADEDGDFGALSGSVAVGRELSEGLRLVGTVARGFRAPNLAELARQASVFAGTELPNPDLDPETSLYTELALELERSRWNAAIAVFFDTVSDVVGSRLIDPGAPGLGDETYLRDNVGRVEVLGVQARGGTRLGGVESPWSLDVAAEWAYGKQYDDFVDPATNSKPFDDQPAQRIPPLHGFASMRYDAAKPWWQWASLTMNWATSQNKLSPQDLGDPRIDPNGTDGWVSFDVDFGGPLAAAPGASWTFGVHNLLDQDYRIHGSGYDAPGLGFVVGLRVSR